MRIIKGVPYIRVYNENEDFMVDTVQWFDDDEDRVILHCAEYVPQFKRGLICDMECKHEITDNCGNKIDEYIETISNLLLVFVRRTSSFDSYSQNEYVFYK